MSVNLTVPLVLLLIVSLPYRSSTDQSTDDDIAWPQAYDEFDEHLINLARSKRQASEDEESELLTTTTSAPGKANTTKNYTIDWAEVEANWVKTISEQEVVEKWNKMEAGLKNGNDQSLIQS